MSIEKSIHSAVETLTGAVPVITSDHASIHEGIAFTLSGKMDIASAKIGAIQLTVPGAVAATLTTNMTAATSDITLTAKVAGSAGNSINVTYVDPGAADQPLTVSVNVKTITVSLATNGAGAITSTAALVKAAINAHAEAAALVTAEDEGTGTGIVNAVVNANLAGGTDPVYCHFKPAKISSTGGPVTINLREDATFAGGTAQTPANRRRIGTPVASKITAKFIVDATITPGAGDLALDTAVIPGTSVGQTLGGSTAAAEEWVLKPGTSYLVTMTNATSPGATVTAGYELFWYEEAGG